jgi:hypothetical protein
MRMGNAGGWLNLSADSLQKRGDSDYGFADVLAKDHRSKLNLASSWKTADWTVLGQNRTTVLHPETTEGPFCKLNTFHTYWV